MGHIGTERRVAAARMADNMQRVLAAGHVLATAPSLLQGWPSSPAQHDTAQSSSSSKSNAQQATTTIQERQVAANLLHTAHSHWKFDSLRHHNHRAATYGIQADGKHLETTATQQVECMAAGSHTDSMNGTPACYM
jgi:hypothetical protein